MPPNDLTAIRARMAASYLLDTCTITRDTDADGTFSTTVHTGIKCRATGDTGSATFGALSSSRAGDWTVYLPFGTTIRIGDKIAIDSESYEVLGSLTSHTIHVLEALDCERIDPLSENLNA